MLNILCLRVQEGCKMFNDIISNIVFIASFTTIIIIFEKIIYE